MFETLRTYVNSVEISFSQNIYSCVVQLLQIRGTFGHHICSSKSPEEFQLKAAKLFQTDPELYP